MNKNDAKEKQQQAKPKTQEDKRSKKGLYKDFENVFDEKWEEKYKDTTDNPAREKANKICIVSGIILLLAIIVSILLGKLVLEFVLCIILLVCVVIVYFWDQKKFASEYESIDQRKMRCAEETINELLGGGDIDVQKKLLFIDEFEALSKKTIPYLVLKYFSSIVSLFCSFFAFGIGVYAGITHFTETLAGLIIVFAVGALFNSEYFKRILVSDRYHQRIVKQYRQYLIDNYLGISK